MTLKEELGRRESYIKNWLKNPEFKTAQYERLLKKYPNGGTVEDTDEQNIQDMSEAAQYMKEYHQSEKFKERFGNYYKLGEHSPYSNAIENYNAAVRTGSGNIDATEQRLTQVKSNISEDVENISQNITRRFDEGEHYLLQGGWEQPFLDRTIRSIKGRPNPEEGIGSHFDPKTNTVWMYKDQPEALEDKVTGTPTFRNIAAHEFSHRASGSEGYRYPHEVTNYQQKVLRNVQDEHDVSIEETKADIDAFRFMLKEKGIYDAGTEDFDMNTLKKALEDPEIKNDFLIERLRRLYQDENLVTLMNLIAQTPTEDNLKNFV